MREEQSRIAHASLLESFSALTAKYRSREVCAVVLYPQVQPFVSPSRLCCSNVYGRMASLSLHVFAHGQHASPTRR